MVSTLMILNLKTKYRYVSEIGKLMYVCVCVRVRFNIHKNDMSHKVRCSRNVFWVSHDMIVKLHVTELFL